MKVVWKSTAIKSLITLDKWREENEWPPIAEHLVRVIETYFAKQDMSIFIPGRIVAVNGDPIQMRMVLIATGKSAPYKVFYSLEDNQISIYLVRHPYQRSIID